MIFVCRIHQAYCMQCQIDTTMRSDRQTPPKVECGISGMERISEQSRKKEKDRKVGVFSLLYHVFRLNSRC